MPGWARGLRAKIGILLCLAALPAAAISIATAIRLYGTTVELNNQTVLERAASVARRAEDAISDARKTASLVALLPGARPLESWCQAELGVVVEQSEIFRTASFVSPEGELACTAGDRRPEVERLLARAAAEPGQFVVDGSLGASSVVVAMRPGWHLAVALPLTSPVDAAIAAGLGQVEAGIIDGNWRTVAGPLLPSPVAAEPAGPPDAQAGRTMLIEATDRSVYRRAIVPIRDSGLFAVAYQSDPELFEQETTVLLGAVAAPLLTIAFTVIAAWIGIDRLALRWIIYLRRLTDAYAAGHVSVRAQRMAQAPAELAALGAAFDRMAAAVGERTLAAQTESQERGKLLRELHHRIRNNFQLVASLVSLQKRDATPPVALALSVHERRVTAIAAAYRVSYADGEAGPVELMALLRELRLGLADPPTSVEVMGDDDLPPLVLDRAVPAAILVVELAAPRIEASSSNGTPVRIRATAVNSVATIEIVGTAPIDAPSGFAMRLLNAVTIQLDATVEASANQSAVTIVFPINPPS